MCSVCQDLVCDRGTCILYDDWDKANLPIVISVCAVCKSLPGEAGVKAWFDCNWLDEYDNEEGVLLGQGSSPCWNSILDGAERDFGVNIDDPMSQDVLVFHDRLFKLHYAANNAHTELYDNQFLAAVTLQRAWRAWQRRRRNAAIVIERAWRLCRYDPAYKMCSTIQLRELEELGAIDPAFSPPPNRRSESSSTDGDGPMTPEFHPLVVITMVAFLSFLLAELTWRLFIVPCPLLDLLD